jgi:hypothetical protein
MLKKMFLILILGTFVFGIVGVMSLRASDGKEGPIVAKVLPWSGYWWPRSKCELAKGLGLFSWGGSPLKKYDKAAEKLTGKQYSAADWELQNHHSKESWHGHCNGWSAASIMEKEPTQVKKFRGIEFDISDQKGLLTESYMVSKYNFWGTRYNGPNDNYDDIDPALFHYLLLTYLKGKGQPLIADIEAGEEVWNYPLYAYQMEWQDKGNGIYDFKVKVWYANDNVDPNYVGTQYFNRTYHYRLWINDKNEVEKGIWLGRSKKNHPDFIWLPYENTPPTKEWKDENPWVDYNLLRKILKL